MTAAPLDRWDGHDIASLRRRWDVPFVEAYASIDSTNDRARHLAEEGRDSWSAVVADAQTRGRGRHGTKWISMPGAGLWMSLIVDGHGLAAGTLPLEVGLACAEAMEELAPGIDVGIKWPNDLLVTGAKVGGILCESVGSRVVVGIGINVAGAPDATAVTPLGGLPPASLEVVSGKTLSRSVLASSVVRNLKERFLRRGLAGAGLDEAALAELNRRDVLAGQTVETDQAGLGQAAGIDASGALRLARADGVELRIVSGGVRPSPGGVPDRREA